MSSKRRVEASRRNGARSQGPKTEAGKSRSSQNATRHGLLAERAVLENESQENFQIVVDDYVQKFEPQDGVEFGMIEEMAASYWRLHRAMAIEKNLFEEGLQRHSDEDLGITSLGRAWDDLADAPRFHTLIRYQSMLHRMHWRAMKNLLLLRDLAPRKAKLPNEPSPEIGHSETPPQPARPERNGHESAPAADSNPAAAPKPVASAPSSTAHPPASQPPATPTRDSQPQPRPCASQVRPLSMDGPPHPAEVTPRDPLS